MKRIKRWLSGGDALDVYAGLVRATLDCDPQSEQENLRKNYIAAQIEAHAFALSASLTDSQPHDVRYHAGWLGRYAATAVSNWGGDRG